MNAVKNIIFWLATLLVTVAIIFVALPMLGHLDYKTIVSGSMEPDIPIGSLVIITPIHDEDIKIGDVITYATSGETTVTHKVIGYELSQNALITHGVANEEGVNEITPYSKVVGKVVFSIPIIGRIFLLVSSTRGKVIAVTVIAALYILSVFFETLGKHPVEEEDESPEEKDEESQDLYEEESQTEIKKPESVKPSELGSWLDGL